MIKPTDRIKHKIVVYNKIIARAIKRFMTYRQYIDLVMIAEYTIKRFYAYELLKDLGGI